MARARRTITRIEHSIHVDMNSWGHYHGPYVDMGCDDFSDCNVYKYLEYTQHSKNHKGPIDSGLYNVIYNLSMGNRIPNRIFGFNNIEDAREWFKPVIKELNKCGYVARTYSVDSLYVWDSNDGKQLVFDWGMSICLGERKL